MNLFSQRVLPLTLLGAAAVLGGCVGADPLEGDDELETQPESADSIDPDAAEAVGTAQQAITQSIWQCLVPGPDTWRTNKMVEVGRVLIGWGHHQGDAEWACNAWVQACKNNGGGCWASKNPISSW
ncbi:hypothetical protein [Sorangium sp. So ce887]|uniref:hypothetical protein n=1 Tax=Sorangium sp. So ce887 TaxID=3133324 RepID=UPI003F60BF10